LLNRTAVSGIIGKLSFDPYEPLALPIVEQMLDATVSPADASRVLDVAPGIALGWSGRPDGNPHVALASSADGTLRAVVDASIDNAAALRTQLRDLGHRFDNTADDELILHAYQQWGLRAFARLRGAFACAIWDAVERRLVLARDHVGIRPLYFAVLPGHGVVFASDVRALLRDPGVGREWCPAAIDAYLAVGYVPAPLTAYRRISKLEAAHVLIVEGRGLHLEPYWDLPAPAAESADERELLARTADCLRRTIVEQANGTAVDGLLYSGGTASTAMLSAAAGLRARVVTVPLDEEPSELVRSGRAASMLGWTRELASFTPDVAALARDLAARCAEPVADPSAVLQLAMCLGAAGQVRAPLAAHGGSTLWAGHARHRVERLEMAVRSVLLRPLAAIGAELGRSLQDSVKGARALAHLAMDPAGAYAVKHAYGFWDDDRRRALYTRGFAWQVRDSNPFARHLELYAARATADPLDRALYVDAHTSLPDSVLAVAESCARAAGIDVRYPLLDLELVACSASIPAALKQRGSAGMYALRTLLARELPPALMPAARRMPARHAWLRPALQALVPSVLLSPRFDGRGVVSRPALRQLWHEHESGRRDHSHRLWSLLMLEFWFRDAIDGNAAEEPLEYAVLKAA
jgi:asparagine synthase (glutamine-hydrolysing)